jgi:undecaprenyl-diphosphatase
MSSTTVPPVAASRRDTPSGLRFWPLRKHALVIIAIGALVMFAAWSAFGLVYVKLLDDSALADWDRRVTVWFENHRTPTWDDLSFWGSMLSDTLVKVALVVVVGGTMIAVWRRWHDGLMLAASVLIEAAVFLFSSLVVDRPRPPVEQLDSIPPSGSFPSGHVAASVAFYGALFVVVCCHTRRRWIRGVFLTIAIVIPIIVATSRMYRGMHHPIDVIAGALLGFCTVLLIRHALDAACRDLDRQCRDGEVDAPDNVRRLDLSRPPHQEAAA